MLVATSCGTRAGLLAGAVAFVLASLGGLFMDLPTTPLGYVNRAVVFLFIGGLTGRFATTLRDLEAESARHFDLSLDMISIAGFDGCFKSVNPAFERTLGYRPEELVGRPFLDFVHPDDREKTEREAACARRKGPRPCSSRIATSPRTARCTGWSGPRSRCRRRA